MKKAEIVSKITGKLNRVGFKLQKHSPEILIVAGVVGTVVSAVMACRATTKLDGILSETKEQMDKLHECAEDPDMKDRYDAEDLKKDTVIVYAHTAVKLAKLYAPAVGLGVLSMSSILASNNILRKRNAALTAAYAAVERGFKEYRSRVVERFGKEVDHQLKCNIRQEEVEETVTDDKGKEKKVKKKVDVADTKAGSPYMRYFTESNPYWESDSDYVEMFIRAQQNYANDLLRATGHVTLNKVYDMLGMKDTKAGMVVGWIYDLEHPTGDNYIEFDVKKVNIRNESDGGIIEAYTIDFNVDGNIYNEMD